MREDEHIALTMSIVVFSDETAYQPSLFDTDEFVQTSQGPRRVLLATKLLGDN